MADAKSIIQGEFSADQAGQRLDAVLARLVPELSRERIKALIRDGRVMLDGRAAVRGSAAIAQGGRWRIDLPQAEPAEAAPQAIDLNVVYEDAELIVIDKPAGLVVHPAAGHAEGTLVNALLHHCAGQLSGIGGVARPGIVHRIDKDTSGLMIAAKTDRAHVSLAQQFAEHSIVRRYCAIVKGIPSPASGTIEGNIGRSPTNRKKMAIVGEGRGKHAVTHYEITERLDGAAMVQCRIETGRTHQIRVHMASLGHPLLGDPVYGRSGKTFATRLECIGFRRQALHAERLGFIHPVTEIKHDYFSPIPSDMRELAVLLRV